MSHWARLIAPIDADTVVTRERITLGIDTPIKSVSLKDGAYTFEAALIVGKRSSGWVLFRTHEDLPAFTDKGSAARENRRATLRPGKPRMGATAATRRLVCKVREDQHAHVERCAEQTGLTVSEHVRRALIADGMPE